MADPGGIYGLVKSQFDLTRDYADRAFAEAVDYLDALKLALDTLPDFLTGATYTMVLPPRIENPEWLNVPEKPTIPVIDFPTASFTFNEIPYTSALHDAIVADLIAQLQSGGTGLSDDVIQGYYNQAKSRTALENLRVRERMESDIASRGFELPSGALQASIAEAIIEETRANADINEKVLIHQATAALENRKTTLTFGTTIEGQSKDYSNAVMTRALNAAQSTVTMATELVKAQVTYVSGLLDEYKTDAIVYSERVKASSIELQGQIDVFKGEVMQNKDRADILLKAAEINLQVFMQNKGLFVESAKSGGNVFAQLAASALSAAHAAASLGYSGSESTSFDETKAVPTTSTSTTYQHVYEE